MADPPDSERFERGDLRERIQRDIERRKRREPEDRFWRALSLLGSVGWPVVLLSTGGAMLGRYADVRWGTGVRFTLMLLSLGTALGTFIAFRTLRGGS
jgi:predicted F0F1-ATPase subunit